MIEQDQPIKDGQNKPINRVLNRRRYPNKLQRRLAEKSLENNQKRVSLKNGKKCLLLTNLNGLICFSTGERILQYSHYEIMGKNFFTDIITPYSLLELKQRWNGQLMPPGTNKLTIFCQVRHPNLSQPFENSSVRALVQSIYQTIKINCVRIYVKFQSRIIQQRKTEIVELSEVDKLELASMEQMISLEIEKSAPREFFNFYLKDPLIMSIRESQDNQKKHMIMKRPKKQKQQGKISEVKKFEIKEQLQEDD